MVAATAARLRAFRAGERATLSDIILVAGIGLALAVAFVMRHPGWRLPVLAFALLAIPGNVDNIGPQMLLDPNDLPNRTAPVVSVVDLLIAWGLLLSLRERPEHLMRGAARWLIPGALAVLGIATVVSVINLAQGTPAAPTIRAIIFFARIPALLVIAAATAPHLRDGRRVAIGVGLGLVPLLGNGLYTSTQLDVTRFTAATFGRNGFSLALVLGVLAAAGAAVMYLAARGTRRTLVLGIGAAVLACAGLFAGIATGTRMSILAAVPAVAFALLINRTWASWRGLRALGLAILLVLMTGVSAVSWTPEGQRAVSAILDPGGTVDIVTHPDEEPFYSPVRTRSVWWKQAVSMAMADPLTGVGAWQWNHKRYSDPEAIVVVADPHNTFLQMAAEHGLIVLAAYIALLGSAITVGLIGIWHPSARSATSWPATLTAVAAIMIPVTEMTNSHFFNVRLGALTWLLIGAYLAVSGPGLRPGWIAIRARLGKGSDAAGGHAASTA
jgi:O-antigen ligase